MTNTTNCRRIWLAPEKPANCRNVSVIVKEDAHSKWCIGPGDIHFMWVAEEGYISKLPHYLNSRGELDG